MVSIFFVGQLSIMFLAYMLGIRDAVGGGTPIQTIRPFSAYNVDIPRSLLSADPTLFRLVTESNFWLGPSQIVAAVNMPDLGDKMNICLISEEGEGKRGEWYTLGDFEKVKKKVCSFYAGGGQDAEVGKAGGLLYLAG
jgi:hypothetical protein